MYKKHSSCSFIALLFVPLLFPNERPGATGMLKAGVACFWRRQILQLPSASEIVTRLLGQFKVDKGPGKLRMATDIKTATNVDAQFQEKIQIAALESKGIVF